jgi:hypothetical protein
MAKRNFRGMHSPGNPPRPHFWLTMLRLRRNFRLLIEGTVNQPGDRLGMGGDTGESGGRTMRSYWLAMALLAPMSSVALADCPNRGRAPES